MEEFERAKELVETAFKKLEQKEKTTKEHIVKWEQIQKDMENYSQLAKQKIVLNIGGHIFATTKSVLLKEQDTFFYGMLRSGNFQADENGEYFVDRDPTYFRIILEWMRHSKFLIESFDSKKEEEAFWDEVDFYRVESLFKLKPLKATRPGMRFWRLTYLTSSLQWCIISGIDFRSIKGVPAFPCKGKATASDTYLNHLPCNAFRGVPGKANSDSEQWASNSSNQWIQFEFTEPMKIVELALAPGYANVGSAPTHFVITSSNDGISWTTIKEFNNVTGYENKTWKIFSLEQ